MNYGVDLGIPQSIWPLHSTEQLFGPAFTDEMYGEAGILCGVRS
jgi:hypothetical protein